MNAEILNINRESDLRSRGYQFFSPGEILRDAHRFDDFYGLTQASLEMPKDPHLNPGEGHRFRYYARFAYDPKTFKLSLFSHSRFFQSKEFDVLYGDIHRQFPPLPEKLLRNEFLLNLMVENYYRFPIPCLAEFEISLHLIRIEANDEEGSGRPAPEGIHQDGYDYGAIHLIDRKNLKGAENIIYDLDKQPIDEMTLKLPLESILFDDRKIFHGVQPFEQIDPKRTASRCMLILLYQPLSESPQSTSDKRTIICSF